jgi:Ca-activated chloride channel family protein
MLARDVEPNRLERTKREIREQLVERAAFRQTNRFALLAFAGSTSLKLPLTTDYLAFRNKLESVGVGSAPRGGTAIAQAIDRATDLFGKSPAEARKLIILFTDGEDHEGDPIAAAREAYDKHGIRTFTVGVGDAGRTVGAQIPSGEGPAAKPLVHDGQIVFSKLNMDELRKIADAGSGRCVSIADFPQLVDVIARMRGTQLSTEERTRHRPRYQWFVAAALLLLGLESSIRDARPGEVFRARRVWQQGASK